jgi:hypothetical protein
MALSEFKVNIDIVSSSRDIGLEEIWDRIVDWKDQSNWMMQTQVWSSLDIEEKSEERVKNGVGVGIWAFTGLGSKLASKRLINKASDSTNSIQFGGFAKFLNLFGILDEMVVTKWEPPLLCEVDHIGRVIRGIGIFRLEKLPSGVRFYWFEEIKAPKIILLFARPIILFGVKLSLAKFRKLIINQVD